MSCQCDDCENLGSCTAVGVGERRERARIISIIEAERMKACHAEGHDERWCQTCSIQDDLLDLLLAAIQEDTTSALRAKEGEDA